MQEYYKIEEYGALFDAHVHTYFDYHDGLITPRQLIRSTKKKGFNYVCAMAHDTVLGTKKIARMTKEEGICCIPGIEVSTIYNHILAFGVQEWPYRRNVLDPETAIEYLREQDCAVFLAHPYSNPHEGLWTPEIVKRLDIDGIEWTNGTIYHQNMKTHRVYRHVPKGRRIAGTDAHVPAVFGYAFTQVRVNSRDPDDVVAAMKRGQCKAYSHNAPLHRSLYMVIKAVAKNSIIRRRCVEGRYVIPEGDHPGSIVPEPIKSSKEWRREILKKPVNPKTERWILPTEKGII